MPKRLTYVDLFAGCGGLSLGLKQAGFRLSLAVEKSDMAAESYYYNLVGHIDSPEEWEKFSSSSRTVQEQAKKRLVVKTLSEVLACREFLSELASKNIDLVAGGPPCQGFSLAGPRDPNDDRNNLAWQFLDFVEITKPKSVVIENVAGMRYAFKENGSSSTFDQIKTALESIGPGYVCQPMLLNAMHFGVPQHRPRVILVGLREDISIAAKITVRPEIWQSGTTDEPQPKELLDQPTLLPIPTTLGKDVLSVKDAIYDLTQSGYSSRKEGLSPYALEMRTDLSWMPYTAKKHRVKKELANQQIRQHCGRVRKRFRLYQALSKQGISPAVISIPTLGSLTEHDKEKRILDLIENVDYPLVAPDQTILAECDRGLMEIISELATKKHSQHPLKWNVPSHTVLSLPDDFVHPNRPRTMTVREMARFQSFPDAFEFRSRITTGGERRQVDIPQYTQVANAVPPKLAKAIGLAIKKVLKLAEKNMA